MKFTLSWLKEHLDTTATLEDISAKLTAIGLEVEGIEDPAKTLKGFVVGHVVSAEKHPDADRLRCLIVDTGTEKLKVVCGAPNARAGMKGVFAPSGSYIPGSDITLKKSNIRGQESNGMMCSARELQLSDEHEGIIELPDACVTGSAAADALGVNDPVIEINLTPNRGDCAGVYGIARDLAAAGIGKLKPLKDAPVKAAFETPIKIDIQDSTACPLFLGRLIKGVKNGPSPDWLQTKLKSIGLRPISALVDITNYLTIGLDRPAHVFDAAKIKGNIHVRASKKGETLAALNDKSYELQDGMTAVCDDSGVLGLGGIVGGVPSSVSEATTDVFVEIALFDPLRTAETGRALMIDSDARYRFERGIDPAFAATGMEIATQLILDICGGSAGSVVTAGKAPENKKTVSYDPKLCATLGGLDVAPQRQKEILSALGFTIDDKWNITAPSWRHDIDGKADIVEEVLRIEGFDKIPTLPVRAPADEKRVPLQPVTKRAAQMRRLLTTRGLLETITWSFTDEKSADLFGANQNQNKAALTLSNPISADLAIMRPSILPNLIAASGRNADRGYADACLFEIGNSFRGTDAKDQVMTAAGIRSGKGVPRHWASSARDVDAYDVKADVMAALESAGMNTSSLQTTADAPDWYHPGRSAALRLGREVVAYFGEIHPAVLVEMGRDEKVAAFEIFLPAIPAPRKKGAAKALLKPSPFQPLGRDFAFMVDDAVSAEKLLKAISGADKTLIADAEIFDVYKGKGVEPGKKSVAVTVTIQPQEKTLTDDEITSVCDKIIAAAASVGASLRQ